MGERLDDGQVYVKRRYHDTGLRLFDLVLIIHGNAWLFYTTCRRRCAGFGRI